MESGSGIAIFSRRTTAAFLSLCVSTLWVTQIHASPLTAQVEISQAVAKTGAANVQTANADQFLRAFASVFVTKKPRYLPACVSAAVTLRKDLAAKIVAGALTICKLNKSRKDDPTRYAEAIVVAAILANPDAAEAIVHAALLIMPDAKDSIVASAIKVAPDQELFILRAAGEVQTMAFLQPSPFGSINPLNYGGAEPVNSPEQPHSGF